jgi:hypothetical protein
MPVQEKKRYVLHFIILNKSTNVLRLQCPFYCLPFHSIANVDTDESPYPSPIPSVAVTLLLPSPYPLQLSNYYRSQRTVRSPSKTCFTSPRFTATGVPSEALGSDDCACWGEFVRRVRRETSFKFGDRITYQSDIAGHGQED